MLGREILVAFREPSAGRAAAAVLGRRAEQAASLLAVAGVTLRRLDGDQALAVLAQSMRPGQRSRPAGARFLPGEVVTGGAR